MSPSAAAARNGTSELTGTVVLEAGRAMVPVLSAKLLAAVADRAVGAVDALAGRLDDYGAAQRDPASPAKDAGPASAPTATAASSSGQVWMLVVTRARVLLDYLVALLSKAAEYLRALAARARRERAPEGIDSERAADEDEDEDEGARAS